MEDKTTAVLRLSLKDELLAYELEAILEVINETYTSLRWLELAETHTGPSPYGDSEFAVDEYLRVQKVEIGTPNFIEFFGLYETLTQTLTYLGGISGVVGILKAINLGLDARIKWHEGTIKGIEKIERISDRAKRLNEEGKVSRKAIAYKEKTQERIEDNRFIAIVDSVVSEWKLHPNKKR